MLLVSKRSKKEMKSFFSTFDQEKQFIGASLRTRHFSALPAAKQLIVDMRKILPASFKKKKSVKM